jgi:threonine/homoserine/homoserine lactone efflux protein
MTLLAIAGTSFVLGLSGAMMPGPLLTVTIAESVRRGAWAGPLLVAGHATLEGVLVLLLFAGLDEVVSNPLVFSIVALIGGLLLLWMGWGMLRSLPSLHLELAAAEKSSMHPLAAGVLVSLSNPYFILWWATIGLGYLVVAHEAGTAGVITFYLFHILSDLVWYALVSGAVSFGRSFLSDRAYRFLVGSCAIFLVGFGFYFGWRGMTTLAG